MTLVDLELRFTNEPPSADAVRVADALLRVTEAFDGMDCDDVESGALFALAEILRGSAAMSKTTACDLFMVASAYFEQMAVQEGGERRPDA